MLPRPLTPTTLGLSSRTAEAAPQGPADNRPRRVLQSSRTAAQLPLFGSGRASNLRPLR